MGFLDAFVRGAGGQGLMQVGQYQQRAQELEAAQAQREKDREDDRKFRLDLARENNNAREDLTALRAELGATGRAGSGSRAGGAGAGGGMSDDDAQAIEVARRMKTDLPTARKMIDRFRNGSTGDPQVDTYAKMSADVYEAIASAMQEGPSRAKAKPDDLAQGDKTRQQMDAAKRYATGDVGAGREGLMLNGKSEYGNAAGSSELTGAPAKGSVAQSQVTENLAQAAKARDGIGKDGGMKLPPAVKEQVDNLDAREKEIASAIVKVQAAGEWAPDKNPGQKDLQASLAAVRLKKQQLITPYMPKGSGPANADPLGLGLGGAPKPPPAPEPTKKEPAPKSGGMLDSFADKVGATVEATRKEGDAYKRIYARWREAGNGGTPLTAEEKAEARKFGLAVKG